MKMYGLPYSFPPAFVMAEDDDSDDEEDWDEDEEWDEDEDSSE